MRACPRGPHSLLVVAAVSLLAAATCEGPITPIDDAGPLPDPAVARIIAMTGPDLEVLEGSRVRLSAYGSRSLDGDVSLVWSQTEGPPILLSDPTSEGPVFVAPLAPATLRFRVRAQRGETSAFDDVVVRVKDAIGRSPPLVDIPGDTTGRAGEARSFPVTVVSGDEGTLALTAEMLCADLEPIPLEVVAGVVQLTLGDELPCVVRAWGVTSDGRRSSRSARVFWPEGTPLVGETRALAPILVSPAAIVPFIVDDALGEDGGTRLFVVDGSTHPEVLEKDELGRLRLQVPLRHGPIHVGAERRGGVTSGGVRFLVIDVSPGEGNRAPVVAAGPDRQTPPLGTFGLNVLASDFDGDVVEVTIEQVLGADAVPDLLVPSLFRAPADETILVFHVSAFDGTTTSPPESVRVVVANDVVNVPPVVELEPALFATPGSTFVIDASNATDPDSGYISRITITQDASDPVIVLDGVVEASTTALTAGAAGDIYRFRVTAFDDAGASASKDIVVTVELAGPYVDALRGDDLLGNGTVETPFASLGAALPVALRHRMVELRLAAGPQLPFVGEGAFEAALVGGHVYQEGAYVPAGGRTTLPLSDAGLRLIGGGLQRMDLTVDLPNLALVIAGAVNLVDSTVVAGAAHTGPLVVIEGTSSANFTGVGVSGGGNASAVLVDVEPGAALRLTDSTLSGGTGGERVGLACSGATLDVVSSALRGGTGENATGLLVDACDVALLDALVVGGSGATCVGVDSVDGTLFSSAGSTIVGCDEASSQAIGLRLAGAFAPTHVEGVVRASAEAVIVDDALAVDVAQPRVELESATLFAFASDTACAVSVRADRLRLVGVVATVVAPDGVAYAFEVGDAPDLVLSTTTASVTAETGALLTHVDQGALVRPSLDEVSLSGVFSGRASGVELGRSLAGFLRDTSISLDAASLDDDGAGLVVERVEIDGLDLDVTAGGDPTALSVTDAPLGALVARASIRVTSIDGAPVGARLDGEVDVRSSCISADGPGSARAAVVVGTSSLRHVTLRSPAVGLTLDGPGQGVRLVNSTIVGASAIARVTDTATPALVDGCVFDADLVYSDDDLVIPRVGLLESIPGAGESNATSSLAAHLDDSGRMTSPAPALVDSALAEFSLSFDVDGDPRPLGLADVGCDEWVDVEE